MEFLSSIPDSSEVAWTYRCGGYLHYGAPENIINQIEEKLKEKKFKMATTDENNFVLCTCEAETLSFMRQYQETNEE